MTSSNDAPFRATMQHTVRYHASCLSGLDAMTADSARSFPRHTHDQYGIGVIDRGGHRSASDARQVEAGAGQLIFVNPGEVHDGHALGGAARAWRMLYLDPGLLQRAREDVDEGAGLALVFSSAVAIDDRLRGLFNALFTHATSASGTLGAMACESGLLVLSAHLRRVLPPAGSRRTRRSLAMQRVLDRIAADPAAPLTLAMLAQEAAMSRFQLHRAFQREVGLAPHAYILQRRLALARQLLRQRVPAADAALAAGFCDQSHLHRWFVQVFGVPPGRYAALPGEPYPTSAN